MSDERRSARDEAEGQVKVTDRRRFRPDGEPVDEGPSGAAAEASDPAGPREEHAAQLAAQAARIDELTRAYAALVEDNKAFRQRLERYHSPAVVDQILKSSQNKEAPALQAQRCQISVLFADISGFTRMSEGMEPLVLAGILNRTFEAMIDQIFSRGGTLDKYIGDAIMAIFGAPVQYPDHAVRACKVCLEMMDKLRGLNVEASSYEGPTGIVGVLNTLCREANVPTASLWANVPHYVSGIENPRAALALVRRVLSLLNTEADLTDLREAAEQFDQNLTSIVAQNAKISEYVRKLERKSPDEEDEPVEAVEEAETAEAAEARPAGDELPPSADLVAEIEQFLRQQRPESP